MIRAVAAGALCAFLAGCGSGAAVSPVTGEDHLSGRLVLDGAGDTSKVAASAAERFAEIQPDVRLRADRSGETTAYARLCAGAVDVVHAARPPSRAERDACARDGRRPLVVRVATDALAVIAHPRAAWARCLRLAQVRRLAGTAPPARWRELGAGFPDRTLRVAGADIARAFPAASDRPTAERADLFPPADEAVVEAVRRSPDVIGFVHAGYLTAEAAPVRRVRIAEDSGCVGPTATDVRAGRYRALARPLVFAAAPTRRRDEVLAFLRLATSAHEDVAAGAQAIGLTDGQARTAEVVVG